MKDLSIEEKAKRYDEVMGRAKKELDACGSQDCDAARQIFRLFPELKESEDEKIRKALVEMVHDTTGDSLWVDYGVHKEYAITWLEKQGEQRSKLVDFDLNANDSDLQEETYFIPNGFHVEIEGNKVVIKKGEQKPVEWSEEDEERLSDAIFFVREYQIPTRDKRLLNAAKETEDWLKSLRPRSTWRPSNEQMNTLEYYMHTLICNKHKEVLFGLYADLKKLREE